PPTSATSPRCSTPTAPSPRDIARRSGLDRPPPALFAQDGRPRVPQPIEPRHPPGGREEVNGSAQLGIIGAYRRPFLSVFPPPRGPPSRRAPRPPASGRPARKPRRSPGATGRPGRAIPPP